MNKWIALAAACWIAGCASTGNTSRPAATVAAAPPAGCVNQTGSYLPAAQGSCSGFGHSYSSTDIRNTGETTVAGALEHLDPTLTTHH